MSSNPALNLLPSHLADLRRSGLTDETIRLSQVYSETDPERIARLLSWEFPAKALGPCLVFPFPDVSGKPTPYSRVRPNNPRTVGGTVAKYESPVGQPNRVYLPPTARAEFANPKCPLIFTEGEKKALAADQLGFATVGLVGVWGWVKKRENEGDKKELSPDLADFDFKGRAVYIAYDSDVLYKRGPRLAEFELGRALSERGAIPLVFRIPAKLGGPKVGLDDFLVAEGPNAEKSLRRLMGEASPCSPPPIGFSNELTILPPPDAGEKKEKIEYVARSASEMAAELVGTSDGWPRNVGGILVVPGTDGATRALKDYHQLFAYVRDVFDRGSRSGVNWAKSAKHATRQEFYEYLSAKCEAFARADRLPHHPPLPEILYTRPAPVPDGKFEALAKLLNFFSPASDVDATLLVSLLMTLFWGGPRGKRPAFLLEGVEDDPEAGRGVGKTTIAQKLSSLVGGAFDLDASETFARTKNRLLDPDAANYRVLLMDNVKTFRLSSADLESLITNPFINGHRLWKGQAGVPNYYTLLITLNGPSLSKDFAQRVNTIRFTRAKYYPGWDLELERFILENRDRIIADIIGLFSRPTTKLKRYSRFSLWDDEILSRLENPDKCIEEMTCRAQSMDADAEDANHFREMFSHVIRRERFGDPDKDRFRLTSSATAQLVSLSKRDRNVSPSGATAFLKAIGLKEMRYSKIEGRGGWTWAGEGYVRPPKEGAAPVINYDPELMLRPGTGYSAGQTPWSMTAHGEVRYGAGGADDDSSFGSTSSTVARDSSTELVV